MDTLPGGSGVNMEVVSLERLKVNGGDLGKSPRRVLLYKINKSTGLGQIYHCEPATN